MKESWDTLAKRLLWARTRKELTQAQLAKSAGVSQGTIGNLESGARGTARKITSIARSVDVDPNWLADGKGPAPDAEPVTPKRSAEPHMVLAYQDEEELLDLYRRSDERGKLVTIASARREAGRSAAEGSNNG